jgi:hypothetical protein
MSQTSPAVVLFIGECDSPQFRRAVPDGKSQVAAGSAGDGDPAETVDVLALAQNHYATSIQEAISLMGSGELVPDLVVAYQSIPDEYPAADIDQLIGMLPMSRFVVAFSQWCESIGRTEQRWPSAWSVPAGHAAARIRFELEQLAAGQQPLPATTSRDEAFGTLAAGSLADVEQLGRGLSATVWSADAPVRECFESVARSLGLTISDPEAADVHILAAAFIDDEICDRVQRLRECCPAAMVIVASDMATPGEVLALQDVGATAVISQLRFAEDLVDHVATQLVSGQTSPLLHSSPLPEGEV